MSIFSGTALHYDINSNGGLFEILSSSGEGNVLFEMIDNLSIGYILSILLLIVIFISYVTAADSNISAMSAICSEGINPDKPEAPLYLKIIWGITIALLALIMITNAGVEGIKMLCVLGGFPALFIGILAGIACLRLLFNKKIFAND